VIAFEGRSTIDIADLGAKKVRRVEDTAWRKEGATPYGWLEHLAWSPDNKRLAFNCIFDGYPAEIIVVEDAPGAARAVKLPPGDTRRVKGYGSPLAWAGPDRLAFLGEEAAQVSLWLAKAEGGSFRDTKQVALRQHKKGDLRVVETFRWNKALGPVLL